MTTRRGFLRRSALAVAGVPARAAEPTGGRRVLVALFLGGGADGLNMVVPHGDPDYYRLRPSIAVPRLVRGRGDTAIDLDGFFGLHPALSPLQPLWDGKHLAIVHAAGFPDPERRHFEARARVNAGWPPPSQATLQQAGHLIRSGGCPGVVLVETGEWDCHARARQSAPLLREFALGLSTFWRDMGDRIEDVTVVAFSEFGRTARENPAGGTDHGHGNCVFILGGAARGGRVLGRWPGLAPEQLKNGRDLAATTDLGRVFAGLTAWQRSA